MTHRESPDDKSYTHIFTKESDLKMPELTNKRVEKAIFREPKSTLENAKIQHNLGNMGSLQNKRFNSIGFNLDIPTLQRSFMPDPHPSDDRPLLVTFDQMKLQKISKGRNKVIM